MKVINIKSDLEIWLVEYITNTIHELKAENSAEFNKWAKSWHSCKYPWLIFVV